MSGYGRSGMTGFRHFFNLAEVICYMFFLRGLKVCVWRNVFTGSAGSACPIEYDLHRGGKNIQLFHQRHTNQAEILDVLQFKNPPKHYACMTLKKPFLLQTITQHSFQNPHCLYFKPHFFFLFLLLSPGSSHTAATCAPGKPCLASQTLLKKTV